MGCLSWLVILVALCSMGLAYVYRMLTAIPELPDLKSEWWGSGPSGNDDPAIRPFKIDIPQKQIDDLKTRLRMTSLHKPLDGVGFTYGVNTDYFKEVVDFWLKDYEWRSREKYLNSLPQFTTQVDGLKMHFIHVKPSPSPGGKHRVLPLLILHGWPGSVREFYEIIPMLTTPRPDSDFVFEVIAPSLPGYGFSQSTTKPGLGAAQVAVVMKDLMTRLGFEKFYIQGGDWGSIIGMNMATLYPQRVLGFHSNFCWTNTMLANLKLFIGQYVPSMFNISDKHYQRLYPLSKMYKGLILETGYFHLQSTKPDTLGVALQDSPAGLAAYMLEKFSTGTNGDFRQLPDGGLRNKFKMEHLLDNIMIYWLSGSITSSIRLYSESFNLSQFALKLMSIPIQVPTACALFPNEIVLSPEFVLRQKLPNLVEISDMPRGGHFAAFEEPKILADHVYLSVKKFNEKILEDNNKNKNV